MKKANEYGVGSPMWFLVANAELYESQARDCRMRAEIANARAASLEELAAGCRAHAEELVSLMPPPMVVAIVTPVDGGSDPKGSTH